MSKKDSKEANLKYHAVLWSDGSARPRNPGFIGWGVHGYVFSDKPTTKGAGHPKVAPTPAGYVDKSIKPQPIDVVNYYDCSQWSGKEQTNNTAEVAGGAKALSYACTIDNLTHVTLYSDSKYFVNGINGDALNWATNGWLKRDGMPVANQDEWKAALEAANKLQAQGTKIKVQWVKGHADNFGNVQADALATIAGTLSLRQQKPGVMEVTTPAQGYWKGADPRNPLLCHRGLLFTTDEKFCSEGEYYLTSQVKSDEFIGSSDIQAGYGYVKLAEPDSRIEMLRRQALKLTRGFTTLMLARIDRIYDKAVVAGTDRFGASVYQHVETTVRNVHFINEDQMVQPSKKDGGGKKTLPIAEELFPVMLAMRAVNYVSALKGITEEFIKSYPALPTFPTDQKHEVHEITDLMYSDAVIKGQTLKVFKKEIGTSILDVHLKANIFGTDTSLQQVFGIHLPPRNTLKRLEHTDVRVWVVAIKVSDLAVRYYSVVKSGGDWSAWCSQVGNLRVFKEPLKG